MLRLYVWIVGYPNLDKCANLSIDIVVPVRYSTVWFCREPRRQTSSLDVLLTPDCQWETPKGQQLLQSVSPRLAPSDRGPEGICP